MVRVEATETETAKPDVPEQTPRERVDLAWEALGKTTSRQIIRAVLAAELAYRRSLRTEADPPTEDETLLAQAGNFHLRREKKAASTFLGNQLSEALQANSIAQKSGVPVDDIMRRIRTCGDAINFIGLSTRQIPLTRR